MSETLILPAILPSVPFPLLTVTGRIIEVGGAHPECNVTIDTGSGRFTVPVSMQMAIDFAKHLYRHVRITVEPMP